MARTIYNDHGIVITKFYGGIHRGVCYHFRCWQKDGETDLTEEQIAELIETLKKELEKVYD